VLLRALRSFGNGLELCAFAEPRHPQKRLLGGKWVLKNRQVQRSKIKINMLTLKDFEFPKTKIEIKEIERFSSEEQFMPLCVELFKEVSKITSILACIYRLDGNGNPRKWTRDEAVLGGLMVRISKLSLGILDQTCQRHMEIIHILLRCFGESLINIKYLLKNKNNVKLFNEYIEYSLREEKRLLNKINQNISRRRSELPIEVRMKSSISKSFETSGFSPKQVNENKWEAWGEKIYQRAKSLGIEEEYFAMFSLPSHFVHGNWQDLITYHLDYENGEFSPRTDWKCPRPQFLLATSLLSSETNKLYLNEIITECSEKEEISKLLDDIIIRVRVADELHEKFLQSRKKNSNP
jgi:hypothetical protein